MRGPGLRHEGSGRRVASARGVLSARSAASWRTPFACGSARHTCPFNRPELKPAARRLGKLIRRLGTTVQYTLIRHREEVLDRQLVQERIAWLAMELFATACALSRWDDELQRNDRTHDAVARLFVADSLRHAETCLREMRGNDDQLVRDAVQN